MSSRKDVHFNCISAVSGRRMVIMEGCVQSNSVYDGKDPRMRRGSNSGPLDQWASAQPTELPGLLIKIK